MNIRHPSLPFLPLRPSRGGTTLVTAAIAAALLGACSALTPAPPSPRPTYYSLDAAGSRAATPMATAGAAAAFPTLTAPAAALPSTLPTLVVSMPLAAAGFDSHRIIYVREPHELQYFAHSEWVDAPSRMLAPLLVARLAGSNAYHAVVRAPTFGSADLRLDTEIVVLEQDFTRTPSRVRLLLRTQLMEEAGRRILASRDIEAVVPAASDDPYGGVLAANQAVNQALDEVARFCAEASRGWRPHVIP